MHKTTNLSYLVHNVENRRTIKNYKRTPRIHFSSFKRIGNDHAGLSDVNCNVLHDYGIYNSASDLLCRTDLFYYINRLKES